METELPGTKELPQTASASVPLGEAVLYPGLRPKQRGQQSWRGSAPLPCAGETLPGALHPDVESSVQERHGPVGVQPERDVKDGTASCEDGLSGGAVQPAEEKALVGRAENGLSVPKGAVRNKGMVFSRACVIGQGGMVSD